MADPSPTPPGRAIARLLRHARQCRDSGEHGAGRAAAEAALQLCVPARYQRQRIEAQALLAQHLYRLGLLGDAIYHGLEAATVLNFVTEARARGEVLCTVAIACCELGLVQDGLKYALEALAAARISDDPVLLSWALSRAGLCTYNALDDFVQSVSLLQQARELAQQQQAPMAEFAALSTLGANYRNLALRLQRQGQDGGSMLQQAQQHYRAAAALANGHANLHLRATAQCNLAEIGSDQGDFPAARQALQQLYALATQGQFPALLRHGELIEAVLLHRSGDAPSAVSLLRRLLAQPQEAIEFEMRVRAHEELYRLYKRDGQAELALSELEALRDIEQQQAAQRSSTQGWAIRKELEITSAQLALERERLQAERERLRATQLEAEKAVTAARMCELEQAALCDALTGVTNRRQLDREGPARLAGLDCRHGGMAVVVLDLDHFKAINDRHGHAVGDEVLRQVAQLITQRTRSSDLVARYGGEEFVLLLMESSLEDALGCCERLRLAIRDHDWRALDARLAVTASFGVHWCTVPQPWDKALRAADVALYQAKRKGRDCLQLASQQRLPA